MSLHHKNLNRRKWAALRLRMLERANWRCAVCGRYGNEVDHIRPLRAGGDPYGESNLQVLCGGRGGCHAAKTRTRIRTPAELEWDLYVSELTGGA